MHTVTGPWPAATRGAFTALMYLAVFVIPSTSAVRVWRLSTISCGDRAAITAELATRAAAKILGREIIFILKGCVCGVGFW